MKSTFIPVLLIVIVSIQCGVQPEADTEEYNRRLPDKTPFISGIIEASNDTTHYYTQVVIGYATDGLFVDAYQELQHIPKLYSPTLWAQVVYTLQRYVLSFEVESEAEVTIHGPLDHALERQTDLQYEGYGIYGDLDYDLVLLAGQRYKLEVTLPDGRMYSSTTIIPEEAEIVIPDSVGIELTLKHYGTGEPYETSVGNHKAIRFEYPKHTFLTETQKNTSIDRELLFIDPEVPFRFGDRGDYLRTTLQFDIWLTGNSVDSTRIVWSRPLFEEWAKEKPLEVQWRRFAFYSEGMWRNHQVVNLGYNGIGEEWKQMNQEFVDAVRSRDSTFLFDVSTIHKQNKEGEIFPKDSLDAIGFFAGNFSVYKTFTLYPIRNFNIDSVFATQGF